MKNVLNKSLSFIAIVGLAALFSNCGGGGGETAPEKVEFNKLKKQWSLVSASLTGVTGPPEQILSTFTLTIGGTYNGDNPEGPYTFSVTGTESPSPWPANGTWEFAGEPSKNSGALMRSDDVAMTYSINSSGQLTISFTCTTCNHAGAKTSQVNGNWTFVLD